MNTIVITAILSSAITLITVWLTHILSNKRLKIQYEHENKMQYSTTRRERTEELFIEANQFYSALIYYFSIEQKLLNNLISRERADKHVNAIYNKVLDTNRLSMIVHLYFPELSVDLSSGFKLRDILNDIINQIISKEDSRERLNEQFNIKLMELQKNKVSLLEKIKIEQDAK